MGAHERPSGSRRAAAMQRTEWCIVNRKRVRRLMRQMGIAALGPKPRAIQAGACTRDIPYLLQGLSIERPNQVWCASTTYIAIGRGFLTSGDRAMHADVPQGFGASAVRRECVACFQRPAADGFARYALDVAAVAPADPRVRAGGFVRPVRSAASRATSVWLRPPPASGAGVDHQRSTSA
ncbi:IS3 family transposase [Bradyrhizobium diazoefficiens]|uniref:IS3 family transposase n=2 Tax=Bradyrhizobium TaxID=374 RepID=UPI0036F3117A